MAQSGQRKCLCCGNFFDLDHRNRERQRFCSTTQCRHASKGASQAAWLAQPQNSGYFRDPVHVTRVQAWRAAHPGCGAEGASIKPVLRHYFQESAFLGRIAAGSKGVRMSAPVSWSVYTTRLTPPAGSLEENKMPLAPAAIAISPRTQEGGSIRLSNQRLRQSQ